MLMTDTFTAAHENLIKNHGTPGLWFTHTTDYCETLPKPRVRLNAIEIADRNRKHLTTAEISGFVNDCSNSRSNFSTDEINLEQKPQLRLRTSEAQGIAQKSKSQSDKWYDFAENLNYQPTVKPPRIGTGELAKAILKNMTRESDWFKHKAFCQSDVEATPDRKLSSGYNRRNEVNNWFAHSPIKKSSSEITTYSSVPSRVKYEGVEYAIRNRGLDDLLTMKMLPNELHDYIPYGCPTEEAKNNAKWSKKGTEMALCLGKQLQPVDVDNHLSSLIRPRSAAVRGSDAEHWRQLGRNGHINSSMSLGTEEDTSNIVHHRVRLDGESILEKSVSGSQIISCLTTCDTNDKDDSNNIASGYRLRSEEAHEAMKRNQGQMSDHLGSKAYSVTQHYGSKFQVRAVRGSEAQEAALNNKGCALKELITHDRLPPSPIGCGFAHVSPEAQEVANLSRTGMISGLLGGCSASNIPLVGVEAPAHRRVQYEAIEYANRDQGQEMKSILTQNWK
ncbi:Beta-ketoacyl synthase [Schistosoma japonicum]|nr:Beta-ketoacyl synthase [Schistosoma japonicum]